MLSKHLTAALLLRMSIAHPLQRRQIGIDTTGILDDLIASMDPSLPENNPDWALLNCDIPSITSSFNDPSLQWNDTGSLAAWRDMSNAYDGSVNAGNFLGDYFHARPDLDCADLNNANCDVTVNCGQGGEANADVSAPAGYILVNSMVQLHRMFEKVQESLEAARVTVSLTVGTFVETFSPVNGALDDAKKEKLFLDGLNFGLTAIAVPAFAGMASRLPYFSVNRIAGDTLKGYGTGFISPVLTTVKDALSQASLLPVQNELADYLNTVIEGWKVNWQATADGIFSDLNKLGPLIYGGQTFDDGGDYSVADLGPLTEALVYANALPNVWNSGMDIGMPFIATSEGVYDAGTGCEGFDATHVEGLPEGNPPGGDSGIFESTLVCIDDQPFWLLSARLGYYVVGAPGAFQTNEQVVAFDVPYGLDALDGSRWGGLTKEQLVINAVNSWKANGNRNGWPVFGINDDTAVSDPTNPDISGIPGAVGLPVCSFNEAHGGTRDLPTDESTPLTIWPCNNP